MEHASLSALRPCQQWLISCSVAVLLFAALCLPCSSAPVIKHVTVLAALLECIDLLWQAGQQQGKLMENGYTQGDSSCSLSSLGKSQVKQLQRPLRVQQATQALNLAMGTQQICLCMLQKLKCDKLMGQASRLQTDFDRLSLRNDLGLSKAELEHIAKRMAPPVAKVRALCYWASTPHPCNLVLH